jgi:hypothetical protein
VARKVTGFMVKGQGKSAGRLGDIVRLL